MKDLQTLLEQLTPEQKKLFDRVKPVIEQANQLPWFIQNPIVLKGMLELLKTLPAAHDNLSMLHGIIKAIVAEKTVINRNTIFHQAVTVIKEPGENKKSESSPDQSLKTFSSKKP